MLEYINFYPQPHEETDTLGTTLIALKYDSGIILATDSLTTRGSFVTTYNRNKITKLWDNVYVMACGNAAHSIFLHKLVSDNLEYHSLEKNSNPDVYTAAHLYRTIIYQNKNLIESSFIICGFDIKKGFQIYTVNSEGALIENKTRASGGSGSVYLEAFLQDSHNENSTYSEVREIATKGVYYATKSDLSSASHINFLNLTTDGGFYEKIENKTTNH